MFVFADTDLKFSQVLLPLMYVCLKSAPHALLDDETVSELLNFTARGTRFPFFDLHVRLWASSCPAARLVRFLLRGVLLISASKNCAFCSLGFSGFMGPHKHKGGLKRERPTAKYGQCLNSKIGCGF